ncbi:MAG: hypothetical protein Q7S06_02295 [Nanoarchaeota archaeon]|nr:hypothetical protein [Nanoarchaeota archaeon]
MTTSCTDDKHPFYKQMSGMPLDETINFFTDSRMKMVSLARRKKIFEKKWRRRFLQSIS